MHLQIVKADRQLTGRYVTSAPHCWGMWIRLTERRSADGTNQAAVSVQVFGPGGTPSEYRSRIFWIDGHRTGRCEGAAAEKAVTFPSDCPLIPNSLLFRCARHSVAMASSLPPEVKRADTTADTTSAVLQSMRFLQRSANLFTQSHCRADFLLRCHEVTTRIRSGHDKQISS